MSPSHFTVHRMDKLYQPSSPIFKQSSSVNLSSGGAVSQLIGATFSLNFQTKFSYENESDTTTTHVPEVREVFITEDTHDSSIYFLRGNIREQKHLNLQHNQTNNTAQVIAADPSSQWMTVIYNPDLLLAFGMIIFYLIFVLFIVAVILRIALTILCSGGGIGGRRRLIALMASAGTTVLAGSGETNSDSYDAEMLSSVRTRGLSQSQNRLNRRAFLQEMSSFVHAERTDSPSAFDDYDDDES